jgi:hypothetical protein
MKELYGITTLTATLIAATLLLGSSEKVVAAPPTGIKNVVLVHGAFADGSGWEAVTKILEKDGYTVSVAQPPKPTWYMVATSDRSINPDQERMMAKRAHAKTVEVNASHVAYMSHPKEAAKLIEEAATSAHAN